MNVYILAEAGVNHNGSLALAQSLVDVACDAHVDAIKFQTFRTEELVCHHAPIAEYQKKTGNNSQFEMLKSLELKEEEQIELYQYCQHKNIEFLSSPFDLKSADFLIKTLNLSQIKIASGEMTNHPLLLHIARAGKSVILSTGMSTLGEIEAALGVLAYGYIHKEKTIHPSLQSSEMYYYSDEGQCFLKEKVILLHCTSQYPAPFDEINLRAMNTMQPAFDLPVGYSDHTSGIHVPIAAVAMGAKLIEKHFTLDKKMQGPDHQASLDPDELKKMVEQIRQIEVCLGSRRKFPTPSEFKNRAIGRKSLVALSKIKKGDILNENNIGCKRPGTGLPPSYLSNMVGQCAERDYEKDDLIGL